MQNDKDLQKEYNNIIKEFAGGTFKRHFTHITEPCIALLPSNGYSVYRHRTPAVTWDMWPTPKETRTVYNIYTLIK